MFKEMGDFKLLNVLSKEILDDVELYKELSRSERWVDWHEKNLYTGNWDVLGLIWNSKWVGREDCFLKERLEKWIPIIKNMGLSKLRARTLISPHRGYTDRVWRLHFGLTTFNMDPSECGIRVEDEIRGWKDGAWLMFDDTKEHEAWNKSEYDRVVLMIDIEKDALQ